MLFFIDEMRKFVYVVSDKFNPWSFIMKFNLSNLRAATIAGIAVLLTCAQCARVPKQDDNANADEKCLEIKMLRDSIENLNTKLIDCEKDKTVPVEKKSVAKKKVNNQKKKPAVVTVKPDNEPIYTEKVVGNFVVNDSIGRVKVPNNYGKSEKNSNAVNANVVLESGAINNGAIVVGNNNVVVVNNNQINNNANEKASAQDTFIRITRIREISIHCDVNIKR